MWIYLLFFFFLVLKNEVRQYTGEIKEIIQGRNTMTIINKIMKDHDTFKSTKIKNGIFKVLIYSYGSWILRRVQRKMLLNCGFEGNS